MRTPLLWACVAACAGGVLVSLQTGPRGSTEARSNSSSSAAWPPLELAARADENSAFFHSDDAWISRLFSAVKEPVQLQRRHALFEALRDLSAEDLPRLIAHVEKLQDRRADELLEALLERWFQVDVSAAERWMRAHPNYPNVGAWVRGDPEGAIRGALDAPHAIRAPELLSEALHQLYGGDHRAKIARVNTMPAGVLRDETLAAVVKRWAADEPAAAVEWIDEIAPGPRRESARRAVLAAWAERNPAGALDQLTAMLPDLEPHALGNSIVTHIAELVGQTDLPLVLNWLNTLPGEFRLAPSATVAGTWAEREPIAALEWCIENGIEVGRLRRYHEGWTAGVLDTAMRKDFAATVEWLNAFPAGEERERLIERAMLASLHHTDPQHRFTGAAISMHLYDQLPLEVQTVYASAVAVQRAQETDAADLQAWARSLPSAEARANAFAGAAAGLYRSDAALVNSLLTGLTGRDRDAALSGLAPAMTYHAPAEAASHALAIEQTEVRRRALGAVIPSWLARDTAGARRWLESAAGIPAEWKQEWLDR